jgi:hypothetical protein
MLANRYRGPPMTLDNMRENGVRSLTVCCLLCHHRAVLAVDAWPDHVTVPSFGPRMVCASCGTIGADARPKLHCLSASGARKKGEIAERCRYTNLFYKPLEFAAFDGLCAMHNELISN